MKIAIIGAGFFGLSIASMLEKNKKFNANIEIFDSSDEPFSGASFNNQCRVHQGFHYPRSAFTIYQSIIGFDQFISEFADAVSPVSKNWYLIRDDGLVNKSEYLAVMDAFSMEYAIHDNPPAYIKNKSRYELSILTNEYSVNLKKLKKIVLSQIKSKIHLKQKVVEINAEEGLFKTNNNTFGPFDLIINCTYNNTNLGLGSNALDLKYELAALVYGNTNLENNEAITIMDGPFVSVYPAGNNRHTLSSVLHTPFKKYDNYEIFNQNYINRIKIAEKNDVANKIIEHVKDYINIDIDYEKIWISGKTKIKSDKGDSREVLIRHNKRVMSVLGGKLDAIYQTNQKVLEYINGIK
ncbi:MAG: hypothetical protein CMC33_02535 [Flavobacteriaceae bacterium]|nr:hypothetical protein [Flavobacteriaceae bacterium]|tara:strand:+ start:1039 stop:2094 length:1056 start_codon:yes stop_codon:yes gene_type:complete